MQENQGQNRQNQRREGGLEARLQKVEARLSALEKGRLVKCVFCKGMGREIDTKDVFALGPDGLPTPCRVCHGSGKIRV